MIARLNSETTICSTVYVHVPEYLRINERRRLPKYSFARNPIVCLSNLPKLRFIFFSK